MDEHIEHPINLTEVLRAKNAVYKFLIPTQLIRYDNLSKLLDAEVYIKHENHNPTGTFKVRGGINLMHHQEKSK